MVWIQCSRWVVCLASLLIAVACDTGTSPKPEPRPSSESGVELFGEPLEGSPKVSLAQLLQDPQSYEDKQVTVTGHVRRACQVKGCWMELAESANEKAPGARVTFKNYGFFVPKDSAGAEATAEGVVQTKRVDAAEVAHLEKDGAAFPYKHPDGSVQEVRLVARGVALQR